MTLAQEIEQSIRTKPESWEVDSYYFTNGSITFWISTGFVLFEPSNCRIPRDAFTFIERWRLWNAYRWWLRNAPMAKFISKGVEQ